MWFKLMPLLPRRSRYARSVRVLHHVQLENLNVYNCWSLSRTGLSLALGVSRTAIRVPRDFVDRISIQCTPIIKFSESVATLGPAGRVPGRPLACRSAAQPQSESAAEPGLVDATRRAASTAWAGSTVTVTRTDRTGRLSAAAACRCGGVPGALTEAQSAAAAALSAASDSPAESGVRVVRPRGLPASPAQAQTGCRGEARASLRDGAARRRVSRVHRD
jgi:hypothetical protein